LNSQDFTGKSEKMKSGCVKEMVTIVFVFGQKVKGVVFSKKT